MSFPNKVCYEATSNLDGVNISITECAEYISTISYEDAWLKAHEMAKLKAEEKLAKSIQKLKNENMNLVSIQGPPGCRGPQGIRGQAGPLIPGLNTNVTLRTKEDLNNFTFPTPTGINSPQYLSIYNLIPNFQSFDGSSNINSKSLIKSTEINFPIFATAIDSNGDIYAAGDSQNVAKWDSSSSTWSYLGSGITGVEAFAIAVDSGSNVYVGGENFISKWNGSTWSSLNITLGVKDESYTCYSLVIDSKNKVYAGIGLSDNSRRTNTTKIPLVYKLNGGSWESFGLSATSGAVNALAFDSNARLYAGGQWGNNYLKYYDDDSSSWKSIGGLNNGVTAITFDSSDNVLVTGYFTAPYNYVAQWNGSTWSQLGSASFGNAPLAIAYDFTSNYVYLGGFIPTYGSKTMNNISMYDGNNWNSISSNGNNGCNNEVRTISFGNGTGVIGGYFTKVEGNNLNYIAYTTSENNSSNKNLTKTEFSKKGLSVFQYDEIIQSWRKIYYGNY